MKNQFRILSGRRLIEKDRATSKLEAIYSNGSTHICMCARDLVSTGNHSRTLFLLGEMIHFIDDTAIRYSNDQLKILSLFMSVTEDRDLRRLASLVEGRFLILDIREKDEIKISIYLTMNLN